MRSLIILEIIKGRRYVFCLLNKYIKSFNNIKVSIIIFYLNLYFFCQVVQGSYAYISPDGTPIQVSYVADENGKYLNILHTTQCQHHDSYIYNGSNTLCCQAQCCFLVSVLFIIQGIFCPYLVITTLSQKYIIYS